MAKHDHVWQGFRTGEHKFEMCSTCGQQKTTSTPAEEAGQVEEEKLETIKMPIGKVDIK